MSFELPLPTQSSHLGKYQDGLNNSKTGSTIAIIISNGHIDLAYGLTHDWWPLKEEKRTMKLLNKRIVFAVLAFGLIGTSQVALAEKRDLTKDEIIEMFSDKTVWGNHAEKGRRKEVYFAPDGTFRQRRYSKRDTWLNEGKWYVNDENLLCMEKNGETKCRRVVDKNGKIKIYKGKKHVWNYTKFKDGNKLR